jgi:hypothetical protein
MGKKCIPGVFCIENMTLFLLFFILIVLVYIYHQSLMISKDLGETHRRQNLGSPMNLGPPMNVVSSMNLGPPMNSSSMNLPPMNVSSVPSMHLVPQESRGPSSGFSQIGILTKPAENLILPLMGRRLNSGRDKYQYYTFSNTGNMNTKLPISKSGKSCTGEYGCDEISNGDTVFVEGYADTFKATIYENMAFQYMY